MEVDLGFAVDHPLGERLACTGSFLDPHGSGRPESAHVGRLAQDRHSVRGQRQDAVDRVFHAHFLVAHDLRHQFERVLHLDLEVGLCEGELGRRERRALDGRDVLRVVEDRAVRVGADLEVAAGLALVHVGVHVAHDRDLDVTLGAREARDGTDVDHLVHRGRERDVRAGHARDARAPHAARDHDSLGSDLAGGRTHASNASVLDVDRDHLGLRDHLQRARCLRALAHDRARAQRVDDSDPGRVEAAADDRLVDERNELFDLGRADERDRLDAPRSGR